MRWWVGVHESEDGDGKNENVGGVDVDWCESVLLSDRDERRRV